ncbi:MULTISPECIES: hypothetical protein [Calothrix]|nr:MULTISPECIES: hypothetical protein [Calothrix]
MFTGVAWYDDQLKPHSKLAKREVRRWISRVGHQGMFVLLKRMK